MPSSSTRALAFEAEATDWQSKIVIYSPLSFKKVFTLDFDEGDTHILTGQLSSFKDFENDQFLIVSMCSGHCVLANTFVNSWISTYALEDFGKRLVILHVTKMEGLCYAI